MSRGSYDIDLSHRDSESESDRLRVQAAAAWKKELRNLELFGLRDGMSVLEVGSGPGYITERLLQALPLSRITAIEVDPSLALAASERLAADGSADRVQVFTGSVMNIDLPDASVDFAIARLVFQHLSDPCGAAREILRTLKPGGKLVVIDSDDGLWGLSAPEIPEMGAALATYGQAQAALGGNRRIGRSLLRILAGAGFVNLDLEALISHSDQLGLEALLPHLDPDRLLPLVAAGVLSEATLHCFQASHRNFLGAQDPLLMMVLIMACGQRPVATIDDDG